MQTFLGSTSVDLVVRCRVFFFFALLVAALNVRGEPVVGEVVLYAGPVCPAGWLVADGTELDPADYPELAAAMGTTHCPGIGGCTPGLFALPDLQGSFARGADPSGGATGAVGESGGTALTSANLPPHTHSLDGIQLTGRIVATTLEGDTEVPTSTTTLGDSNRTSIYKAATPDTPMASGSAVVEGTAADLTQPNTTSITSTTDLLPPYVNLQYCVASGGDTAPLIEVGLEYTASASAIPSAGSLSPTRIDVSGFTPSLVDDCFEDGTGITGILCLADLAAANPDIGRPNIRFKLVGENACQAYRDYKAPCFASSCASGYLNTYPGELTLTGVQVAWLDPSDPATGSKSTMPWGNEQFGGSAVDFKYTLDRDAQGNYGFIAVDLEDERTLVMETRNINNREYQYRVQARCGDGDVPFDLDSDGIPDTDGDGAYYVYWDPKVRHDGRGSGTVY